MFFSLVQELIAMIIDPINVQNKSKKAHGKRSCKKTT